MGTAAAAEDFCTMLTRAREVSDTASSPPHQSQSQSPGQSSYRSHDRHIIHGTLWVVLFLLVAKLVSAGKEIVLAARYGTSAPVDAYLLLFRLYDLPVSAWLGALGVTFVPLFFRMRQQQATFDRFREELNGATIVAGIVLGIAAAVVLPVVIELGWFSLPSEVGELAASMAAPMALMLPLGAVTAVVFARLVAAERRSVTLAEGVPAAVLLVALLIFTSGGPAPLVWGTVAGYAAALVFLLALQARVEPFPRPSFRFRSPLWPQFLRFTFVIGAATFILGLTAVIDQLMVASLGPSAIATLGYALRLLGLATSIGATAITRVILPVLSDVETTDGRRARHIANRWALVFVVLGAVGTLVGWVLAPFVVQIMFQRGAFTPADTAAVSEVLRFGLLQLPFAFSSAILAQLWAARRGYMALLYINAFAVAVKVLANIVLIDRFGINGAMMATAIMYAVFLVVLWGFAHRTDAPAATISAEPGR